MRTVESGLVPAEHAVRLVPLRVERPRRVPAASSGSGVVLAHLLEALLGAPAGLLGDVGVVDRGLEAGRDALFWLVRGRRIRS